MITGIVAELSPIRFGQSQSFRMFFYDCVYHIVSGSLLIARSYSFQHPRFELNLLIPSPGLMKNNNWLKKKTSHVLFFGFVYISIFSPLSKKKNAPGQMRIWFYPILSAVNCYQARRRQIIPGKHNYTPSKSSSVGNQYSCTAPLYFVVPFLITGWIHADLQPLLNCYDCVHILIFYPG